GRGVRAVRRGARPRRLRVRAGRARGGGDARRPRRRRPRGRRVTEVLEALSAFFLEREWIRVVVDVFDIVLVAYLFYRVLLLIRGTRAMQMGIGLVLVFLVYTLARRVGLITLFTILDGLLTYIALIIVVLFQNDIRRALMRVGSRPFF